MASTAHVPGHASVLVVGLFYCAAEGCGLTWPCPETRECARCLEPIAGPGVTDGAGFGLDFCDADCCSDYMEAGAERAYRDFHSGGAARRAADDRCRVAEVR